MDGCFISKLAEKISKLAEKKAGTNNNKKETEHWSEYTK